MKRSSLESASLAVAFGAAVGAFVSAFAGLRLPMALLVTGGASLLAWLAQRHPVRARRLPPMTSIVRIVLLVIGLLAMLSRDIPLIAEDVSNRVGLLAGVALLACAVALLWAGSAWPAPVALVPAILGLLVGAGLQGAGRQAFVPLACIGGTSLWTWALVTGGPRQKLFPLVLFLLACTGVGAGVIFLLPWAQPYVEAFAARGLASGQTGLSNRSELGDFAKIARSRRVIARVWTTGPQLLRMQVLTDFKTDFKGKDTWLEGHSETREVAPDPSGYAALGPLMDATPGSIFPLRPSARASAVEARVMPSLSWDDGWGLLVPAHPSTFRAPAEKVKVDDDTGSVVLEGGDVSLYGVASGPPPSVPAEPPLDDPTRKTLDNERIRHMAADIGGEQGTAQQKVSRTVEYLKREPVFRYTLDGLPGSLDEFLEKKAGHCEYFATAAVLLLRQQGVPARYVRGVRVNPESKVGDHYVVRESDAHAWIEAYLPGEGWVEKDPTPAGSGASGASLMGSLAARWEAIESWFLETWIRLREEGWPGLRAWVESSMERLRAALERHPIRTASTAVAVALALVAWGLRKRIHRATRPSRRRRQDRAPVPAELRDLVGTLERRWARAGRPRPPNRGLREHLDGLAPGALTTEEREAAASIVATYYRTRYGGAPLSGPELSDLRTRASALLR